MVDCKTAITAAAPAMLFSQDKNPELTLIGNPSLYA
jgi:hypothetical protein